MSIVVQFFPAAFQQLLASREITDIMVTNSGAVFIDSNGTLTRSDFNLDAQQLRIAVQAVARSAGKDINERCPILDVRLPDGSRVAALANPASLGGWSLTIRRFNCWFSLDELIDAGTVSARHAEHLLAALEGHRNILVAGGTSAGKSTLVNALIGEIPLGDRLILIEKPAELSLQHPNVLRWEATDRTENTPAVTVGELVSHAMRHRPDRIVVGEVKDASAFFLLQALNSGHSGSLSTIHADSATLALDRLSGLAIGAYPNLHHAFIRQETANAIHLVAHMVRKNRRRFLQSLIAVDGYDPSTNRFVTKSIEA
ncbi:MAG TPA: ATPase, T2SS/T4P/T4SS family [Bryobacteraceae bacterium]|nr:ATPase, T2SS/T4P/T4SS family [Bryobacteraceae bacterium]